MADAPGELGTDRGDATYRVALPTFEGPLDLLLHLVQKHELSIQDLPVSFITAKYLEYLSLMQVLQIDVASEYLVMAATLAHLKSKTLLPPDPSQDDGDGIDGEEIDPRQELIRRLLEYQKYKDAGEKLGGRSVAGRDVFGRPALPPQNSADAPLAEIGIFASADSRYSANASCVILIVPRRSPWRSCLIFPSAQSPYTSDGLMPSSRATCLTVMMPPGSTPGNDPGTPSVLCSTTRP